MMTFKEKKWIFPLLSGLIFLMSFLLWDSDVPDGDEIAEPSKQTLKKSRPRLSFRDFFEQERREFGDPIELPIEIIELAYLNKVFDDDTGEISDVMVDFLNMNNAERVELERCLSIYMKAFGRSELARSERVEKDGDSFLRLNACQDLVRSDSDHFLKASQTALGEGRGSAAQAFVNKQLRKGGVYRVEISLKKRRDLYSIYRIINDGMSTIGGAEKPLADILNSFRWGHLTELKNTNRNER